MTAELCGGIKAPKIKKKEKADKQKKKTTKKTTK